MTTDPITAAQQVVETQTFAKFDGVLLDLFTASLIIQIADALKPENRAKLQNMTLIQAADLCLAIAAKSAARS